MKAPSQDASRARGTNRATAHAAGGSRADALRSRPSGHYGTYAGQGTLVPSRRKGALGALWILLFSNRSVRFQSDEPAELDIGGLATRRQRVGQIASYAFESNGGETLLIEVSQAGLDFAVQVRRPNGIIESFNSPLFRDESEFILLENTARGTYGISVLVDDLTNASGAHSICISRLSPREEDSRALSAWRCLTRACASDIPPEEALGRFEEAARLWQEIGDTRRQAHAAYCAAMVRYWYLADWSGAAERAAEAAELYGTVGQPALQANATLVHGYALIEAAGDLAGREAHEAQERALAALEESCAMHAGLGNLYDLGHVSNNLGLAYFNRGDYGRAARHWREAEEHFASVDEWRHRLNVRQSLALIELDQGLAVNAALFYEKILSEFPEGQDDPLLRGVVLANLGLAQCAAGNLDAGLESFSAAVEVHNQLRELSSRAFALQGIGNTYHASGKLDLAEQYLREALEKSESAGRHYARILADLGNVEYLRANYEKAFELHVNAVERAAPGPEGI